MPGIVATIGRAEIFAALGIAVALIRYGTYIHDIFRGQTRPHVFSWLNWSLMVGIGAVAQYRLGGGPSVIVLMMVTTFCAIITIIALFRGEKNITRTDWLAFTGALVAIPVWQTTSNPLAAILVLMAIDILSYYPTLRKTWVDPWSESAASTFWAGLRYFFALLAVAHFTLRECLYPLWLMAGDWGLFLYIFWLQRRATVRRPALPDDPASV